MWSTLVGEPSPKKVGKSWHQAGGPRRGRHIWLAATAAFLEALRYVPGLNPFRTCWFRTRDLVRCQRSSRRIGERQMRSDKIEATVKIWFRPPPFLNGFFGMSAHHVLLSSTSEQIILTVAVQVGPCPISRQPMQRQN